MRRNVPAGAIRHDGTNVVVDVSTCNCCMACIAPCPTASIDNWRIVAAPYSVEEPLAWSELRPQQQLEHGDGTASAVVEALDESIAALLAEAHKATGGPAKAPLSASKPTVNLFRVDDPLITTVQGNHVMRATGRYHVETY